MEIAETLIVYSYYVFLCYSLVGLCTVPLLLYLYCDFLLFLFFCHYKEVLMCINYLLLMRRGYIKIHTFIVPKLILFVFKTVNP